ncbi:hypothetical protein [Bacillus sp. AFS053548]|uniref:hypothetical protein n=1 Tax=Bacillus sp. AFS053548 TaxID=2033505 RepID=UPI00159B8875|nr:hypothetical protein [Bacillus sp. AFS053548]
MKLKSDYEAKYGLVTVMEPANISQKEKVGKSLEILNNMCMNLNVHLITKRNY